MNYGFVGYAGLRVGQKAFFSYACFRISFAVWRGFVELETVHTLQLWPDFYIFHENLEF